MSTEAQNWLLGPGGQIVDGPHVIDGPHVPENIAVIPEFRLQRAEEALREIARGRLSDPIQFARNYFEGRTAVEETMLP